MTAVVQNNISFPLTPADMEFEKMTKENVFNHRIHTLKEEAKEEHTDDVRPKPKKKGKRVSWGTTQVKEIPRITDPDLWHSAESKSYCAMEKTIETFWRTGKGHIYRWTINDEGWEAWCKYQDRIGANRPNGPTLYEQYLDRITC